MITLAIVVVALALRLISLNQSLWLDEAIGAVAIKDLSFRSLVINFSRGDNHPPLYYLLLKVWTTVFGYSEISLRAPSVILGILTVYLFYKLIEVYLSHINFKSRFLPFFAALFLATSGLHVYYSQEARMYVPVAFLALFAVYFFLKTLIEKKKSNWFWFSLGIILLVFTDYMPVFLLPLFPLYGFNQKIKSRKWWLLFIASFAPLFILGLLWLPIFKAQSLGGKWLLENLPAWRSVAGGASLKQLALVWIKFCFGRISFTNKGLYYSLIVIFSIPVVFSLTKFLRGGRKFRLVLFWLIIPLVFGFIASAFFPAFIYFRYLFVLPVFYLALALGIWSFKNATLRFFLTGLVIIINLATSFIYLIDRNQQREDWRGAVLAVEARLKENEAVAFLNPEPFAPYRWYSQKVGSTINLVPKIGAKDSEIRFRTNEKTSNLKGIYLFDYLNDINDPHGISVYVITQA